MHLGIDLGTTHTVVAAADRGNYPVVHFEDADGDLHDHFPSVSAVVDGELVHGFEAVAAAQDGAPVMRSLKRRLADADLTLESTVTAGGRQWPLLDVFTDHLRALRQALETSTLDGAEVEAVVVGVPAHAHTAQRLFTLEAFRRAGFQVRAMVNEPSAAGFEYTHRQARTLNSRRNRVLVYDLGGGTFDASLVSVEDSWHEVLDTVGINRLGGDDFDRVLATCVLGSLGVDDASLDEGQHAQLLEACRGAKEALSPQTRRLAVEFGDRMVQLDVSHFYQAATGLVRRTIQAMEPLVSGLDVADSDIAGIYLVGGSSGLPLVPRVLREQFGRRVHRSPQPGASTAIGLAIAADPTAEYTLTDRLSRGFGVFREGQDGREVRFDVIFSPDQVVSPGEPVVVTRRYQAVHNVGWFRLLEYSRLDVFGQPRGEVSPRGELLFGFDPSLQGRDDLAGTPVVRLERGPWVEERYTIDENNLITVQITDLDTGHQLHSTIG